MHLRFIIDSKFNIVALWIENKSKATVQHWLYIFPFFNFYINFNTCKMFKISNIY